MNNFGMNYSTINKTIGICIENNEQNKHPENIFEFFKGLLSIIYKNVTSKDYNKFNNVIILRTGVSINDFNFSKDKKLELMKDGYKQTKHHIKYNNKNRLHYFAVKYVNNIINKSIKSYINIL